MNHEQATDQAAQETSVAWDAFQYWTGSQDVERFHQAYLGHYPDRQAFGEQLLSELGADRRLQRLPDWLRAYVRLDGAAVVADFEQAGHYHVVDAPDNGGTYVFDGYS